MELDEEIAHSVRGELVSAAAAAVFIAVSGPGPAAHSAVWYCTVQCVPSTGEPAAAPVVPARAAAPAPALAPADVHGDTHLHTKRMSRR